MNYFKAYENYFWQWEEEGEVLAIRDSYTILYKKELIEILETFSGQCLPQFGSLLLVIIATGNKPEDALKGVYNSIPDTVRLKTQSIENALEFLRLLIKLPKEYKSGKTRVQLMHVLFENSHRKVNKKDSVEFINYLSTSYDDKYARLKLSFYNEVFYQDFRVVDLLRNRFPTTESIVKSITALPEIPEDLVPLLEKNKSSVLSESEDLLKELIEDTETFQIGALVKRLWSGLHIPYHNTSYSQQSLGGIADISNKGSFDKLLISEFANDDLVFLSRLANNEALFYNRETPPSDNKQQRVILIDMSLKNWGTTKTISYAVMLAIAHHPKTDIECTVYVVGDKYQQIGFKTVQEIIAGLYLLKGTLHPAKGLDLLFAEKDLKDKEVILITNSETLEYSEFQKLIGHKKIPINYWVHPNKNGEISVYKSLKNSKKFIQSIQLPLKELWTRKRKSKKENKDKEKSFLDCPILFPNPYSYISLVHYKNDQLFKITKEKVVFRLKYPRQVENKKGWEVVRQNLRIAGNEHAVGENDSGELVLLNYSVKHRMISLLNMITGDIKYIQFDSFRANASNVFFFLNSKFYFILNKWIYFEIDLDATITKIEEHENEVPDYLYNSHRVYKEKIYKFGSKVSSKFQIFKNVKRVCINTEGQLVFNVHVLYVNVGGIIKLDPALKTKAHEEAVLVQDNAFQFQDGSRVTINPSGMIVLESSDENIETIYIPSLINRSLGIGTENDFAGNKYFMKNATYRIILKSTGDKKIAIIKTIKGITGQSLKDLKEIVDTVPSTILEDGDEVIAMQIVNSLTPFGAEVIMELVNKELKLQSTRDFFNLHVNPFIKQIIRHGTSTKEIS